MTRGGVEESFASQYAAARAFVPPAGVTTGCVGTDCNAAVGKKKRSTKRPEHRKGRPSREGWRAVEPHPSLKRQGEGRGACSVLRVVVPKWYGFPTYAYIYIFPS